MSASAEALDPRIAAAIREGYAHVRLLPTGEIAGLQRFIFTVGLIVGINGYTYRTRFCYAKASEAIEAITTWDGKGSPPGYWIKEKGRRERHNPRVFYGIRVVVEHSR
jgi:hypothetical protein